MGLLEKHLNELQSKPSKDKKETGDADGDNAKENKTASKKPSSGSTNSSKEKKGGKKAIKGDEKSAAVELTPQASNTASGFVRTLPKAPEPKETPAMDMKESDALKKSQETVPAAATGEKKQILPKASIEMPVDEPSYEVSEPSTVKSILARAKEVLKSLDDDKDEKDEQSVSDAAKRAVEDQGKSSKKSDITRKKNDAKDEKETEGKAVKQVAKLAASLAKTANKYKNGKAKGNNSKVESEAKSTGDSSGQFSNEKKPKPGPKKSGLSATGPGRAGMGNTP